MSPNISKKPKRIAWYPPVNNPEIASVRLRCLQPMRLLREKGYITDYYKPGHYGRYDAVIFSKNYGPEAQSELERLQACGTKVLADICDNHLYNPESIPQWTERGEWLRSFLTRCDGVITASNALRDVVMDEVSLVKTPKVIPDAVDLVVPRTIGTFRSYLRDYTANYKSLRRLNKFSKKGYIHLVWFGNHGSPFAEAGMSDVDRIYNLLHELYGTYRFTLSIISNNRKTFQAIFGRWKIPVLYFDWNLWSYHEILRYHHICLLPITHNQFTMCKTNNRVALSLTLGLGVVADRINSYEEFSEVIVLDDWQDGLTSYIEQSELLENHVKEGREIVLERYNLDKIGLKWKKVLDEHLEQ